MGQRIGIHHVNLRVADYFAAKAFYVDGLGCRCEGEREHKDGFMMSMLYFPDGGILELVGGGTEPLPEDSGQRIGSYVHLALEVEDVETALGRLLEAGGTQCGEIKDKELPFPMHIAVVKGTAGELVELLKVL